AACGLWAIDLDGCVKTEQHYLRNTPILVTRHEDDCGNAVEITDFCPRFTSNERIYRPVAFMRIVRPMAGSPRIRVRLRPTRGWGDREVVTTSGSHHIRYVLDREAVRLSTDAPVGYVEEERFFRVERPIHFFLGPDESFSTGLAPAAKRMLHDTVTEWQGW